MFGLLDELETEFREHEARGAALLTKVRNYDRSGQWHADGFFSAASALSTRCQMDRGVAHGHVNLARNLEHLPEVAAAFGCGEISSRHATVIANAFTPERAETLAEVESNLVDIARTEPPKTLGGIVKRLTDALDGDGGASGDDAAHKARSAQMSRTLGGRLDLRASCGALDAEIMFTAVEAEMERDHQPDDPRTTPQRRMDAIVNLMRRGLDRGELGESRGVCPHVSCVVDVDAVPDTTEEILEQARTERRARGYLSDTMIDLLLCDCDVSRVIRAGKSEILDVGRATRTVSAAQWKALVVRDRHCQVAGCNRPPQDCQAHHIVHWSRPWCGPTNLDNLQLLRWNHHRERHIQEAKTRARPG